MSGDTIQRSAATRPAPPVADTDRRSNQLLRVLIDDMLDRIRQLNRRADAMAIEDRARAEAELDTVMARVRRLAAGGGHQQE